MKKSTATFWSGAPAAIAAMVLSIPAFYLILTGPDPVYMHVGYGMYAVTAILLGMHIVAARGSAPESRPSLVGPETAIFLGALASAWPTGSSWSSAEWLLRLAYCALVFIRLSMLSARYVAPHRLLQTCMLALLTLAVAGLGFLWLEPRVHSYADGVWLAFTTGATVGYGDLVPSTPASRIFASFIVLLGYALFSVVTASIAALLVGEDEKRMRKEMHADMRLLMREIAELRGELQASLRSSARPVGKD